MKSIFYFCLAFFVSLTISAQTDFIQVQHSKVLCTLSFLDTASKAPGSAPSYMELIEDNYQNNDDLQKIIDSYKSIDLQTSIKRERYPEKRHPFTSSKDLLWIASANSENLQDFSQRIVSIMPPSEHKTLIAALKNVQPYYDELVWNNTHVEREQIEKKLQPYKGKIEDLFKKVIHFLGSEWPEDMPFKIMLYPIPLEQGGTTAIPKGNNLICSYLSSREGEHSSLLGIAIHEMDHILFDAQPLALQNEIDTWFTTSTNPYAAVAYDFFDEGLATAVGNGWAYEKINGSLDPGEWYNFEYIDGYGKALYPVVKEYMSNNRTIDKAFVENAIQLFGETFPGANTDLDVVMNNLNIFAQAESEQTIGDYFDGIQPRFRMRSAYFSSPLQDEKSKERFLEKNRTKFIIVDEDHKTSVKFLQKLFSDFPKKIDISKSSLASFYDKATQSPVILINLKTEKDFIPLLDKLARNKKLEYGKIIGLK